MKTPPYFENMHSGKRSIVLEENIDYDSFAPAAKRWAEKLDLHILNKTDGPDARIWTCERRGGKFCLVFDDWFPRISLEPQDAAAAADIPPIGALLGIKADESIPGAATPPQGRRAPIELGGTTAKRLSATDQFMDVSGAAMLALLALVFGAVGVTSLVKREWTMGTIGLLVSAANGVSAWARLQRFRSALAADARFEAEHKGRLDRKGDPLPETTSEPPMRKP